MFGRSRSFLVTRQKVLFWLHEAVLIGSLLFHYASLACLSGWVRGLYQQRFDFSTALSDWMSTVGLCTLVLLPWQLLKKVYVCQLFLTWLQVELRATFCKPPEQPPAEVPLATSNKEQRFIRKKARRKAARAGNAAPPEAPSAPQAPAPQAPASPPSAPQSGSSTSSSFSSFDQSPPIPAAHSRSSIHSHTHANVDDMSQEGWRTANNKKAKNKKAKDKSVNGKSAKKNATSSTPLTKQARPGQPTSSGTKAAPAAATTKSTKAAAASGAAASSRQSRPSSRPAAPAPTDTSGFSASNMPRISMNTADALVGLRRPLQVLKEKISLATQALAALACLETGHEQIRSYRSIRGDGNCGYRAVLAGLIEGAQGSATLKAHLLQRLPELYTTISGWTFIAHLHPQYGRHLHNGFTFLMDAIMNPRRLSTETLLGVCRQQKASDEMLLFVRAICAAGVMLDWESNWECLHSVLAEHKIPCSNWGLVDGLVYAILPLANENQLTWMVSAKGLVAALGIGLSVFDMSGNVKDVTTWPHDAQQVHLKLLRNGCHYDLL